MPFPKFLLVRNRIFHDIQLLPEGYSMKFTLSLIFDIDKIMMSLK